MQQLDIGDLIPGKRLEAPLFHSSGEILLEPGYVLTPDVIRLLGQIGIEQIFRTEPGEDAAKFVHEARNSVMPVSALQVGQKVDRPIFDRFGALLVEAGAVVTDRMGTGLSRRGINQVYVRRSPEELRMNQVVAFRQAMRRASGVRPEPVADQIDGSRILKAEDCTMRKIDDLLEALTSSMTVPRSATPMQASIRRHAPLEARPQAAKDGLLVMYDEAVNCTTAIFQALRENADVEEQEIGQVARSVIGGLLEEQNLLLNLNNMRADRGYLVTHSLAVTMLAISTAAARGYDRGLVLEMAYASYLHDIGMLRLPKEIVEKPGRLEQSEVMQVRRHPVYSLDMLQRLVGRRSGVPTMVPIVAYQSHERENGSGYPKGRNGRLIHEFTKIVAACDVYQAMTSPRPWRSEMLPYQAMEQVVLMGARRELDPDVVRAMLSCVSLFPIGSWVELSDGSRARVVSLAGSNYAKPVVSVTERKGQRLSPPQRLNLSENKDVEVLRPVPPPADLVEVMEGF